MKKIFLLLFLLFTFRLSAAIDSSRVAQLIQNGSREFCHILDINDDAVSSHKPEQMQFIIDVPVNYVHTKLEGGDTASIFASQSVKDSLNARIRRIYMEYGIELYIVVINSLDVIVHTDLPAGTTSNDFFIKKLYNEQTNLDSIKKVHDHITQSILGQSLSGHNRDCIVYSDAQYRGCFFANGKKGCWEYSVVSDHQGNYAYPKLSELQQLFSERLLANNSAHSGGLSYMLPVVVDEFSEAAKYFQLEARILQAWTPGKLDSVFHEFHSTVDYEHLTLNDRKHAVSVYTGFTMTEGWFGALNQEGHVINILKYTPAKDVHELLYILGQPNELKNNPDYHGDASDDALIKKLIDRTDDVGIPFFSTDNYTALVQAITQLELSSQQTCEENLPDSNENWMDRIYYWDESALFADNLPVGTHAYDVTLSANGSVSVQQSIVDTRVAEYVQAEHHYIYYPHWDADYAPVVLKPFDLVFFTNRSTNGMLQSVAGSGQVYVAPAIFLKYADDKTFNANAVKNSILGVNAIAFALGPGAIIAAVDAGNYAVAAFEAVQSVGAATAIAASGITDPDVQSVVDKFNTIVGIWGLSSIVTIMLP